MGSTNEFGGKGSSVVETIESQEMEREITEQSSVTSAPMMQSSPPSRQTRSSVTSSATSKAAERALYLVSSDFKEIVWPSEEEISS